MVVPFNQHLGKSTKNGKAWGWLRLKPRLKNQNRILTSA
jgi:hypothetical protein